MSEPAYRVIESEGRFAVVQDDDRVIMACADRGSAEHYASLMSRAFERGQRAARRAQREAD